MNKVICDICGTTYPETSDRCPICGAPRTDETQAFNAGSTGGKSAPAKEKGGHFSANNVKKRTAKMPREEMTEPEGKPSPDHTNRALMIVLLCLILAIVCAVFFIYIRFFSHPGTTPTVPSTQASTMPSTQATIPSTQPTQTDAPAEVPCVALRLEKTLFQLTDAIPTAQIQVTASPDNTTDSIRFVSDNPAVVTVSETGLITAVASGNATVTITCGNAKIQCVVVVSRTAATDPSQATDATEATQPTQTDPTAPTETQPPVAAFTLDTYDVTMRNPDESFRFYPSVDASLITWSSDNTEVAVVDEKGRVTAVGVGITIIRAQYKEQERECIIRNTWLVLDASAITLEVGKTDRIDDTSVIPSSNVKWTTSDSSVVTVKDGVLTAVAPGTATVTGSFWPNEEVSVVVTVVEASTEPSEPETTPSEPSETESTEPSEPETTPSEPSENESTEPSETESTESSEPTETQETTAPTEAAQST